MKLVTLAAIACGIFVLVGCQGTSGRHPNGPAYAGSAGRIVQDLSGPGWRVWLDKDATWKDDELFLPGTPLGKIPSHPPTGGWSVLSADQGVPAAVPGTVEAYFQKGEGPSGDIQGVSWWVRSIKTSDPTPGRRTLVELDAARQRAEVYLDGKLVGYDLVGNTPFSADLTDALASGLSSGREHLLAIRVTDFGGNFDWRDSRQMPWGKYKIPASHGFGGVSGRVRLVSRDSIAVDDIYVQNTPSARTVNVIATLANATSQIAHRDVVIEVFERNNPTKAVFSQRIADREIRPGESTAQMSVQIDDAKLWEIDSPNLYTCRVSLEAAGTRTDSDTRIFGFRWFAPENIGEDAVFRLNGRRIVLRTAISWGFWPVNGLFPSPELAEREIRIAKAMGQNMLNFHRAIGNPISLETADELGLLLYEEPGGYKTGDGDDFAGKLATEKLLRMVKRDRSHPSLIIYNMINEGSGNPGKTLDHHAEDMQLAHAIDPSRVITHTSGWAKGKDVDDGSKMHMRPYDNAVHMNGWYDFHRAGGPETWQQKFYKGPSDFYNFTDNKKEIVYWGEEGAISSPPRLEKIKAEIERNKQLGVQPGWDSAVYLDWYDQFHSFIDRKGLGGSFPSVDALTASMGNISIYHQGRKIEQMRMNNVCDGYAVNGWEAELIENHSGIVDCYRNPKGDASILAYYNQPLYIAVKSRSEVVESPGRAMVDFYIVNEQDLKGDFTLEIEAKNPAGQTMSTQRVAVKVDGGEHFGQLLAQEVNVPVDNVEGLCEIQARLLDASSQIKARGREKILAVQWKNDTIKGRGAVWEADKNVSRFLGEMKNLQVPTYSDEAGKLDWVVVTRPPNEGVASKIPAERMTGVAGDRPGIDVVFLGGSGFKEELHRRVDPSVDLAVDDGASPDPAVSMTSNYAVRFEGQIIPGVTGEHTLIVQTNGATKLTVNGQVQFDALESRNTLNKARIAMEKDKPVSFVLEFRQNKGGARCKMTWAVPEINPPSPGKLLDRVRDDGTTLVLLDQAETWMKLVAQTVPGVKYSGEFKVGTAWLGGSHFVRRHPLFDGLPTDGAMDWPYQALVKNGRNRSGFLIEGEELVAGAYHSYPMRLGTAVGVVRHGKGQVVFSTLDISENLLSSEEAANVARKVLCNFLRYAMKDRE